MKDSFGGWCSLMIYVKLERSPINFFFCLVEKVDVIKSTKNNYTNENIEIIPLKKRKYFCLENRESFRWRFLERCEMGQGQVENMMNAGGEGNN